MIASFQVMAMFSNRAILTAPANSASKTKGNGKWHAVVSEDRL